MAPAAHPEIFPIPIADRGPVRQAHRVRTGPGHPGRWGRGSVGGSGDDVMENETTRNMILWFFLALFLASIYLMARLIWPFVSILVMAAVVSGMFSPVYRLICRPPRINSAAASLLTCLLIFVILFVPIVLMVGILSGEAFELVQWARHADLTGQIRGLLSDNRILEQVNDVLARFNLQLTGEQINQGITELGKVVGLFIYRQSASIASNLFKFLVNFFFMLLIIYFLLIDGRRLVRFIFDLSPLPEDQDEKLIGKFKDMAGAILVGNGFCARTAWSISKTECCCGPISFRQNSAWYFRKA